MIRLQKALADRGVASRRAAEELITAGRVRVDGALVTELGTKVAPDARIDVDGAPTHVAASRYIALYKPKAIVSTAHDERGRRTVVDMVAARERLYPVGRLDADSEGLILLTNDGAWAERVLHPRYGHEREYEVTVGGELSSDAIARLRAGVRLEEGVARAVRVDVVTRSHRGSRLRVVLRTGWKRQIRRMCAAVGLRVDRLVRVRIGPLRLGRLHPGESRELTKVEVSDLARPVQARRGTSDGRGTTFEGGGRATDAAPRAPAPRGTPRRPRRGVRGDERVSAQRPARYARPGAARISSRHRKRAR